MRKTLDSVLRQLETELVSYISYPTFFQGVMQQKMKT